MRIAFDFDDTLIRYSHDFPLEKSWCRSRPARSSAT